MSTKPIAIGVDIGGSSTKMGVVTIDGEILCRAIQPTPPELPADTHLEAIIVKLKGLVDWTILLRKGLGLAYVDTLLHRARNPIILTYTSWIITQWRADCVMPLVFPW